MTPYDLPLNSFILTLILINILFTVKIVVRTALNKTSRKQLLSGSKKNLNY